MMPRFADPDVLLTVTKARRHLIDAWIGGVRLEERTGKTLDELRERAAADRLSLALDLRRRGDRLVAARPAQYRDAVSRYYYAMYHAMRATVFFVEGGDDHQEHKVLPSKTPADLVDSALWQNALKDARTTRNAADYDRPSVERS